MDRRNAVRLFIKQNWLALVEGRLPVRDQKKLRREFIQQHRLGSGQHFEEEDVARTLAEQLARLRRGQPPSDILDFLGSIPAIGEVLDSDELEKLLPGEQAKPALISAKDLSRLREETFAADLQAKIESEAKATATQELISERQKLNQLQEEWSSKLAELEKFRSELDQLPQVIPDYSEMESQEGEGFDPGEWWLAMGLHGNPFFSDHGLIGIQKADYDRVVVPTKFVSDYVRRVERNPREMLGKSTAILGEFGSGKTTLLDYLGFKISTHQILPVKVILNPNADSQNLVRETIRQIASEIIKGYREIAGSDWARQFAHAESMSELGGLLGNFSRLGGKGLLICIDGLHKGRQFVDATFEYLQQVQNLHEYIQNQHVSCGFLIAGYTDWQRILETASSMSGSIYKIEVVPPLTEDAAVDAVVRRINAFVPVGRAPPVIQRESLRAAFKTLGKRTGKEVTFRSFLNHVRDRLEVGEYAAIGVKSTAQVETLELVHDAVLGSSIAGAITSVEAEAIRVPGLRAALNKILPGIYLQEGITETEPLFKRNRAVFQLLRQHGLVAQRRSMKKSFFVWAISPPLLIVLEKLYSEHKVPPHVALASIFATPVDTRKQESSATYERIVDRLESAVARWTTDWRELAVPLELVLSDVRDIDNGYGTGNGWERVPASVQSSILHLVEAVQVAGGARGVATATDLLHAFSIAWYAPENIDDIQRLATQGESLLKARSDVQSIAILHQHADVMSQLLDLAQDLISGETVCQLRNKNLSIQDLRILHDARIAFQKQELQDCIELVADHLEEKVRDAVYVLARTAYGANFKKIHPKKDVAAYEARIAERGPKSLRRAADENFFRDLSRSEYSSVVFHPDVLAQLFPRAMPPGQDAKSMREIWDICFGLANKEKHNERAKYFREHQDQIIRVLGFAPGACAFLNQGIADLLAEAEFSFEKSHDRLTGRLILPKRGVQGPTISFQLGEAINLEKVLLKLLDRAPRQIVPLEDVCVSATLEPEAQVAVLAVMLRKNWLRLAQPLELQITETGRRNLREVNPIR